MEGLKLKILVTGLSAEDNYMFWYWKFVIDRVNRKAYCALSEQFTRLKNYSLVLWFDSTCFTANQSVDGVRKPIYHTNVMMCLGEDFCCDLFIKY
jgi:hypothetical protein